MSDQRQPLRAGQTLRDPFVHPFQLIDRKLRPSLKEGIIQNHPVYWFSNAITSYHKLNGLKKSNVLLHYSSLSQKSL